jgi:uncharacterized membrane protein
MHGPTVLTMNRLLAIATLGVGAAGLLLALSQRRELVASRQEAAAVQAVTEAALARTQRDLDALRQELDELRATAQGPPPALPKMRRAGLEDLRQQLKAAHEAAGAGQGEEP